MAPTPAAVKSTEHDQAILTIDLTSPEGLNDGHHGALAKNTIPPVHDEGDHSPTPSTPAHQTLQPSPASPAGKGDTVSGPEAQSLPPSQGRNFFRDGTLSEETKSAIIRRYLAEWTAAGYIAATDLTPPPPPAVVARSNSPDEARDQVLTSWLDVGILPKRDCRWTGTLPTIDNRTIAGAVVGAVGGDDESDQPVAAFGDGVDYAEQVIDAMKPSSLT